MATEQEAAADDGEGEQIGPDYGKASKILVSDLFSGDDDPDAPVGDEVGDEGEGGGADDEDTSEDEDADEAPEPAESKAESDDAEEDADVDLDEELKEADGDELEVAGRKISSWKSQIARYRRSIERKEADLEAKAAKFETDTTDVRKRAEWADDLERAILSEPLRGLAIVAQKAGTTSQALYEQLTRHHVSSADNGDNGASDSPAMREIAQLRRDLAQRDDQMAKTQRKQDFNTELDRSVDKFAAIPANEQLAEMWPALAKMSPKWIKRRSRELVAHGLAKGTVQLNDIADLLDEECAEELAYQQGQETPAAAAESSAGQGSRKPGKSKRRRRGINNADGAETSGARRDLSPREQFDQAGGILVDELGL